MGEAEHPAIRSIAEQVAQVPTQPGCYLWKDGHGTVIYVGKAKNLRSRMRQYVTLQDDRGMILIPFRSRLRDHHIADFVGLAFETARGRKLLQVSDNLLLMP